MGSNKWEVSDSPSSPLESQVAKLMRQETKAGNLLRSFLAA